MTVFKNYYYRYLVTWLKLLMVELVLNVLILQFKIEKNVKLSTLETQNYQHKLQ